MTRRRRIQSSGSAFRCSCEGVGSAYARPVAFASLLANGRRPPDLEDFTVITKCLSLLILGPVVAASLDAARAQERSSGRPVDASLSIPVDRGLYVTQHTE